MSEHITGELFRIDPTVQRTERFSTREFVLKLDYLENSRYEEYLLFKLINFRCGLLDGFSLGQRVTVDFGISGRKWTNPDGVTKYFNSLDCYNIHPSTEPAPDPLGLGGQGQAQGQGQPQAQGYGQPGGAQAQPYAQPQQPRRQQGADPMAPDETPF